MARLGRGFPAHPTLVRPRRPQVDARFTLPSFELVDEFPALSVTTPDARFTLPSFELVDEFPALNTANDIHLILPDFELVDEFPELTVGTPILPGDAMDGLPGQAEWNGFVLGRGTPYAFPKILAGWRTRPKQDSVNVPEPSSHGAQDVRPLLGQRVLLWTGQLKAPPDEIEAAVQALEQATPVLETGTPWPLVVNDLGTPYLVYGRITNLDVVNDFALRVGLGKLVLEWTCSDPRRYSLRRTGVNLPLGQTTTLINAGNVSTYPIIRIDGPRVKPALLNLDLNRLLEFNLTLDEGERLIIDPKAKTATIGDTIVIGDRTSSSVPIPAFVLGRGVNRILHTAQSGSGPDAVALYRDAWT